MNLAKLNLTKIPLQKEEILKIPKIVGVYVFWDINKQPLYVGKSTSLRNRLDSYLANDLLPKTKAMVSQAHYFSTITVASELESLLLEAYLVKENQPKYNIELKDDKSPLYIKITKDVYPRVITARKAEVSEKDTAAYFGPFPSSSNVKMILKLLRRVFHYSQHLPTDRSCLYAQMGLCSPCPSQIEKTDDIQKKAYLTSQYKKNITYIKMILSGKMKLLTRELKTRMETHAKNEEYEEAHVIKILLDKVLYITQPVNPTRVYLENPNFIEDRRIEEMHSLQKLLVRFFPKMEKLDRIECYDIAHIAGAFPTASMVVFKGGDSDKSEYRHFKVSPEKGGDDYASLQEIGLRRKRHFDDWGIPDLIIVDGGKGQLKIFLQIFQGTGIPIIGLAKREETLIIPNINPLPKAFTEIRVPDGPILTIVQRIRNEAHRFARRLHHAQIKKTIISS